MYISSMHRVPTKRLRRSRINRYVCPPYCRQDAECVIGGVREGCVAVDGADAEEGEGGVVGGEEDGEGVLCVWLASGSCDDICRRKKRRLEERGPGERGGGVHRVLVIAVRDDRVVEENEAPGALYRAVPVSQSSQRGICSLTDGESCSIFGAALVKCWF